MKQVKTHRFWLAEHLVWLHGPEAPKFRLQCSFCSDVFPCHLLLWARGVVAGVELLEPPTKAGQPVSLAGQRVLVRS